MATATNNNFINEEQETYDPNEAIQKNPAATELLSRLNDLLALDEEITKSEATKRGSIWEVASEEAQRKRTSIDDVTTIYFLGSEHGGKTSLLNLFLEKEQVSVEPTLALDFSFARRLNVEMEKDVCHFWELGGDPREWTNLIDIPIVECHRLQSMAIFIVLDLSEPKQVWPVFETVFTNLKIGFTQALKELDKSSAVELSDQLDKKLTQRLSSVSEEDRKYLKPYHLPIVIIGTKYDLFQNVEPETSKTMCRILRLVSHLIGASLCFYSKDDMVLKRRFRELVSHYAFNTAFPKEVCFDHNQPLMIRHGSDSFDQIWPSQPPSQCSLEFCRHHYESKIGKDKEKSRDKIINPILDPRFSEPDIDRRRAECLAEMERERRTRISF